jgi:hypothetical protein
VTRGPGEASLASLRGTIGSPDELASPFSGERAACWLFALVIERAAPGSAVVGYSSMRAAHLGAPLLVETTEGEVLLPAFSYNLQLAVQPLQRPRLPVLRPIDPSQFFLVGDPWTPTIARSPPSFASCSLTHRASRCSRATSRGSATVPGSS